MIRDSQEIILIDKPKGITSFDVIRFLRKKIGFKKMGHAGTLDPLATGLLIVGVGQGTKKLRSLIKLPKTYQASVLLGIKTDTADLAGKVLTDVEVKGLDSRTVRKVVKSLEGRLKLKVPAYSAVKVKGERLYALSRKGKIVSPPEREMVVFKAKFKRLYRLDRHYILELELEVASGTYIRSIAEEIGRRLGWPATLSDLRRTKIGEYKVEAADKLDQLEG